MQAGTYVGPQFRYHKDATIDRCLHCLVPVEDCTGGENVTDPRCQFYQQAERKRETARVAAATKEVVT